MSDQGGQVSQASRPSQATPIVHAATRTAVSDFYSLWSLVVGTGCLVLCVALAVQEKMAAVRRVVSAAAFANATTVGFLGAAILAFKGMEIDGSVRRKLSTNFVLHALPAFAATALYVMRPIRLCRREKLLAAGCLIGLQALYAAVPCSQRYTAFEKIERLYHAPPAVVCCAALVTEVMIIAAL